MIEYKGYLGAVEFDPDIETFHGTVINISDVISFYGTSVPELRREMKKSVEEYLAFCREQGRPPEQPFSGKLVIQTNPDLHRRIALEASRRHLGVSTFVEKVLEDAVAVG